MIIQGLPKRYAFYIDVGSMTPEEVHTLVKETKEKMNKTVEFDEVFVEAETDKAILCIIENEDIWVPKSQVHDDSEVWEKGQDGTLIVNEWWAEQKGLV